MKRVVRTSEAIIILITSQGKWEGLAHVLSANVT